MLIEMFLLWYEVNRDNILNEIITNGEKKNLQKILVT